MLVDDSIILFRSASTELENPHMQMMFCTLMHVCGFMKKMMELLFTLQQIKKKQLFH